MPSLRRCLLVSTVLFAAAASTAATAGLTQALVNTLPEQPPSAYTSALPGYVEQARNHAFQVDGAKLRTASVMIAPVVLNWAPEGIQGRAFPPWWEAGADIGGVQVTTNEIHRKVVDAFRSRGWGFYTPAWLREQGASLEGVGGRPLSANGRSHGGGTIAGYPYVSEKLRSWDRGDFLRLRSQHPGPESVALIHLNSIWIYQGHSRMNGEAIVNYDVYTSGEVQVCDATRCATASLHPDNALKAVLPIPAEKATNEDTRANNNGFAMGLASDYFSAVALAMIEQLIDTDAVRAQSAGRIVSTMRGQCIDVPEGRFATGTQLQVWDCGDGNPNQKFTWDGAQVKAGGLCFDVLGSGGQPGDPVALSPCGVKSSQQWTLKDGNLRGVNDRCLGIGGGKADNGARLVLWDCTGAPDQGWSMQ
jgi:hypothetical protein